MSEPASDPHRPAEQPPEQPRPYGATPYDEAGHPPYVYNPYGNVSYPSSYPVPPAGLGPDDAAAPPVRRPGSLHLALVLLLLASVPYLFVGFLALAGAGAVVAEVPPEQLAQIQQLGVDLEQVIRAVGTVFLAVALLFVLLAVLAWTGRRWARALLAAMTVGFVLMVVASLATAGGQGMAVDGASLVVLGLPVALAAAGVAVMFGPAARAWFDRSRRR